jgi:hypothetical protein
MSSNSRSCTSDTLTALVILGDVPGAQGSGSGTSGYYLLQFNSLDQSQTITTRLRIGYTAMCCEINGGKEHCAITVGKDKQQSLRYLSIGSNDATQFFSTPANLTLNPTLYDVGSNLQNNVFVVFPAIPASFLAASIILLIIYSAMNKPWVGPASSWRQSQRNKRLDIMRIALFGLLGLSIVFSFAAAVANSQLFAAVSQATSHNVMAPGIFTTKKGSAALALHWLAVVVTILFFIGITQTHVEISAVKIKVNPGDTAGTTGSNTYAASGDTIERSSLLGNSEPMAMAPTGVAPQMPPSMGGGPGGPMSSPGMRGGPMGMRGGPMGARGGPMGARGGPMMRGRGGPMGARGRGM